MPSSPMDQCSQTCAIFFQVLIEGYDHLCPWTGTGIGHGNMLAFKMFVVGVNVLCYFSIGLVAFVLLDGLVHGK